MAGVLSTQPGVTASVACYAGALRGTDSAEPPLQLRLDSPAACECLLDGLLRMLGHCLELQPLQLGGGLAPALLDHADTLLLCSSSRLQASAMRFLTSVLAARELAPCSPAQLLGTLALAVQQQQAATESLQQQRQRTGAEATAEEEWWQQLASLLRVLVDAANASPATAAQLLPRIARLAVAGAVASAASDCLQLQFCQLAHVALRAQPALLEGTVHQLLPLFLRASPACRQLLLQGLALYLQQQQQLCGAEAVSTAFAGAALGAGLATEVRRVADGLFGGGACAS